MTSLVLMTGVGQASPQQSSSFSTIIIYYSPFSSQGQQRLKDQRAPALKKDSFAVVYPSNSADALY